MEHQSKQRRYGRKENNHMFLKGTGILILSLSVLFAALLLLNRFLDAASRPYSDIGTGNRMVFLFPGLNETEDRYKAIEGYYSDAGITPVFLHINWLQPDFKKLIQEGREELGKVTSLYPDREYFFFGFSFGAVIALNSSQDYQSGGTLLCSLSPVFREDYEVNPVIRDIPGWVPDFLKAPVYRSIQQETTVFLYGDQDSAGINSKPIVELRKKTFPKSKFRAVKGAKHDITNKAYLEQIRKEINKWKQEGHLTREGR